MLQPVGVVSVSAIGGSSAGLYIGGIPAFRSDGSQESGGMEGAGSYFKVQRLQDNATSGGPELLQGKDQTLEG